MAKCYNCKKPIPDGATFCGHCGAKTLFEPNQPQEPPFAQYQVQPYEPNEQQSVAVDLKTKLKPNCDLSVAGFVLSLFNPLMCVVAFILSAAALAKKQARKSLAIAGLIISLIEIALIVGMYVLIFVFHIDVSQYAPWLKLQ